MATIDRSGEDDSAPEEIIQQEAEGNPIQNDPGQVGKASDKGFKIFEIARNDNEDVVVDLKKVMGNEEKSDEDKEVEVKPIKGLSNNIQIEKTNEDLDKVEPQPDSKPDRTKGRDYSIFDPKDVPFLKKMGNESFDWAKKNYLELREAKNKKPERKEGDLPDSYYEHPEAYVLAPQFKQVSVHADLTGKIQEHWKRQEININKKGKVSDLGYNEKTGQLIYGAERDATDEDAVNVENLLTEAREQSISAKQKLKELTGNFKNRVQNEVQALQKEEERLFPGYGDENHETQPAQKELLNKIPPSLRNSPLAKTLAKSGAALGVIYNAYIALEKELNTLKGIKQDVKGAPPKKGAFVATSTSKQPVDFSIFQKARSE